jgi:hypothetical protein
MEFACPDCWLISANSCDLSGAVFICNAYFYEDIERLGIAYVTSSQESETNPMTLAFHNIEPLTLQQFP